MNQPAQSWPVETGLVGERQLADIYRREVAGLERQQRQFAAGVGRFHLAELRRGILAVDPVDEDQARLAAPPGELRDQPPYFSRLQPPRLAAFPWIDQGVVPALVH